MVDQLTREHYLEVTFQTRKLCFLAIYMVPEGGQSRKHNWLPAMFLNDEETRKYCFLALFSKVAWKCRKQTVSQTCFPKMGKNRSQEIVGDIFLARLQGGQTRKSCFRNKKVYLATFSTTMLPRSEKLANVQTP